VLALALALALAVAVSISVGISVDFTVVTTVAGALHDQIHTMLAKAPFPYPFDSHHPGWGSSSQVSVWHLPAQRNYVSP